MRRNVQIALAAAAVVFGPALNTHAQLVGLGKWDGALEGIIDFSRQDTTTGDIQESSFDGTHGGEQVTLRNAGAFLYDPKLLKLSLGGTFGLSQDWLRTDEDRVSRHGTLRGYDVFAAVLGEQATGLNLFASRDQSFLSRELAGRNETVTENRGVTLFARRLYLPSTLTIRQETQEDDSLTGGVSVRREDVRNSVTYEGQRGWVDHDLALRYEFIDLAAKVTPALSYQSHEGDLDYGVDFGTELNRHWDSRLHYLTRAGATDLTTITTDETLRFDHSARLWTELRYFLTSSETLEEASTTHLGAVNVHHKLYENLTTTAGGDATIQTLPGGQKEILRSQLDLAYNKRVPMRGHLTVGLGGRLEYQDARFDTTESFVPQETHAFATPIALPITLNNPFVVSASVVVTKSAFGPLPAGCVTTSGPPLVLALGRDYTLLSVGNSLQIVPIGCSGATPGINPGDAVAVDYRFGVFPSVTFTTQSWRTDLSVDYRWIRPYVAHVQTAQHLLSGRDDGLLDQQESDVAGIELRKDGSRLHANLLGEASRFASNRVSYTGLRSTQFVSYAVLPDLTLSVSADEAVFNFLDPEHQTRTLVGGANVTYAPLPTFLLEAISGMHWLKDSLLPTEQGFESTVRVRWVVRQLELSPALEFLRRQRGDTSTREFRAFLRVIRRL